MPGSPPRSRDFSRGAAQCYFEGKMRSLKYCWDFSGQTTGCSGLPDLPSALPSGFSALCHARRPSGPNPRLSQHIHLSLLALKAELFSGVIWLYYCSEIVLEIPSVLCLQKTTCADVPLLTWELEGNCLWPYPKNLRKLSATI